MILILPEIEVEPQEVKPTKAERKARFKSKNSVVNQGKKEVNPKGYT